MGYSSGRNNSSLNTPPNTSAMSLLVIQMEERERTFIRRGFRTVDVDGEVAQIVVGGRTGNTGRRIGH